MNASFVAPRPRLARQSGVLRIEIAAVVMLSVALVIVLITHVPERGAQSPTAVAVSPAPGQVLIGDGPGAATGQLQRIAVPQPDTAGAVNP